MRGGSLDVYMCNLKVVKTMDGGGEVAGNNEKQALAM